MAAWEGERAGEDGGSSSCRPPGLEPERSGSRDAGPGGASQRWAPDAGAGYPRPVRRILGARQDPGSVGPPGPALRSRFRLWNPPDIHLRLRVDGDTLRAVRSHGFSSRGRPSFLRCGVQESEAGNRDSVSRKWWRVWKTCRNAVENPRFKGEKCGNTRSAADEPGRSPLSDGWRKVAPHLQYGQA